MTVAIEERRLRSQFERIEVIEDIARTLPEGDERRERLLAVSDGALADEDTVRPVIAARLLGLSEKTIRAWVAAGVLAVARRSPRLLLDTRSVHAVSHLLTELRAAGQDRDLLDQVWRRLTDAALLERDDLRASLSQMSRGEGRVLRPMPADTTEVLATPRADQQIAGLDPTCAKAFSEFLDDLAAQGCKALG
jgi:hypothetical protein